MMRQAKCPFSLLLRCATHPPECRQRAAYGTLGRRRATPPVHPLQMRPGCSGTPARPESAVKRDSARACATTRGRREPRPDDRNELGQDLVRALEYLDRVAFGDAHHAAFKGPGCRASGGAAVGRKRTDDCKGSRSKLPRAVALNHRRRLLQPMWRRGGPGVR